jgi:hypothetical protein
MKLPLIFAIICASLLGGTTLARADCDASFAFQEMHRAENAARVKDYPTAHAVGKGAGLAFEDCRDSTSDPSLAAIANLMAGLSFAISSISISRYGDQDGDAQALAREARRDFKAYLSSGHTDYKGRATVKDWLSGLEAFGLDGKE